jgi:hypothetical protein
LGAASKFIDMRWRLARLMWREPFDCQNVAINLKLTIAQRTSLWCGIHK